MRANWVFWSRDSGGFQGPEPVLLLGPWAEGSHPGGEHLDSGVERLPKKVQGKEIVIGLFVMIN